MAMAMAMAIEGWVLDGRGMGIGRAALRGLGLGFGLFDADAGFGEAREEKGNRVGLQAGLRVWGDGWWWCSLLLSLLNLDVEIERLGVLDLVISIVVAVAFF
jgi:hypothetical protein